MIAADAALASCAGSTANMAPYRHPACQIFGKADA
jgi:hypothetical protein